MLGTLALLAVAILMVLYFARSSDATFRGAVRRGDVFHCPHCDIQVSPDNPMVDNFSGLKIGARQHRRWCQVCERNAEQHLIHRA